MSEAQPPARCRSCGREFEAADLDAHGWCERCRARVIRKATWVARAVAIVFAVVLGSLIAVFVQPTRFVAGWMALLVGAYFFVMKVVRRVIVELRLTRRLRARRRT